MLWLTPKSEFSERAYPSRAFLRLFRRNSFWWQFGRRRLRARKIEVLPLGWTNQIAPIFPHPYSTIRPIQHGTLLASDWWKTKKTRLQKRPHQMFENISLTINLRSTAGINYVYFFTNTKFITSLQFFPDSYLCRLLKYSLNLKKVSLQSLFFHHLFNQIRWKISRFRMLDKMNYEV